MSPKSMYPFFCRTRQAYVWWLTALCVALGSLSPIHLAYAAPSVVDDIARNYSVLSQAHGLQTETGVFAPQIAMDSNGNQIVIAWTDLSATNTANVYAQVIDTKLLTVTHVISVATGLPFTTSQIVHVDAGIDDSGRFAVVYDQLPPLSGLADIGLNRYNADGTPYGTTFVIGAANRLDSTPAIDLAANGQIIVAYDQANGVNHRFNYSLFAAFENLNSSTNTSISSSGAVAAAAAFNDLGHSLICGTTLPSGSSYSFRIAGSAGTLSSASVVTSALKTPMMIENVPGSSIWRTIDVDQVGGQNQILSRLMSLGANVSVAPVISSTTVLAQDSLLSEKIDLTVDNQGGFAIAYRRVNGASENELVTSRYNSAGTLISSRIQMTGTGTSPSYGLARGADVSRSLVGVMAQTEFTETTGGLVDFELRLSRAFGPFAEDDSFNTLEETPVSDSVASNDSDLIEFYPLVYTMQSDVSHGALTFNPDGSFTYTPSLNYVGMDAFHYSLANNLTITDTASVTLTVTNVNDAPVAVADTATIPEEQSVTLSVLANDSDVDSGALLSLTAVGTPAHGSVAISGTTQLVYTPTLNFVGTDSFTYTMTDGDLGATATVTVIVTNVNDAPVAVADSYHAIGDLLFSVSAPGLLSNDSDVDGDPLTAVLVTGPGNGSLTLNADGSFNYTSNPSYTGADSFTYQTNDGKAASNVVTVSLTISAPEPTHTTLQTTGNPAIIGQQVTLTATVTGLARQMVFPSGLLTFQEGNTVLGTSTLSGGSATLTKSDWSVGIHLINAHYQGDGAYAPSNSTALSQRVDPVALAVNDAAGTFQGQRVMIAVLANDQDPAAGGLTVMNIAQPAHGVATLTGDNQTVSYTPTVDFHGIDSFTYTLLDSNGHTNDALVTIVVSAKANTTVAPQIGLLDLITSTQLAFTGQQMGLQISVPAGVYSGTLGAKDIFYLSYSQLIPTSDTIDTNNIEEELGHLQFGYLMFDLSAYLNDTHLEHFQLIPPLTITITYDPVLLGTLQPATLTLLYWNGTTWSNDGITILNHDVANHQLTVTLAHLSEFGLFGAEPSRPLYLYLPLISQGRR